MSDVDFAEDVLCRSGDLLEMTDGCEDLLDEVSDAPADSFCAEMGVPSEVAPESLASRVFMSLLSCLGPLSDVCGLDVRVMTHSAFEEFRAIHAADLARKTAAGAVASPLPLAVRLAAFDYLIGEVEAERMLRVAKAKRIKKQQQQQQKEKKKDGCGALNSVNPFALELVRMSHALGVDPAESEYNAFILLDKVQCAVEERLHEAPDLLGPLLFPRGLGTFGDEEDMLFIKEASVRMHAEYSARRQLMLKRAEAAVQAALWSHKGKERREDIVKAVAAFSFRKDAQVFSAADLVLAHTELALPPLRHRKEECQANAGLKKLIMCDVPDRGGRPLESRMVARESRRNKSSGGSSSGQGDVVTRHYRDPIHYVDIGDE